jgi:hypothetical protein
VVLINLNNEYSNCGALLDVVLKENLKGRRLRTKSNKENIRA